MGETELTTALQRENEEQIRQVWRSAEQTLAQRRAVVEQRLEELQQLAREHLAEVIREYRETHLPAVRLQGLKCRLDAEAALEDRLFQLAEQLLPELIGERRDRLWNALAGEVPGVDWGHLRVNPADCERARQQFPGAEISGDVALAAGLIATSVDGLVRIDNSLNRRLQRAWAGLLPQLMQQLRPEDQLDAAAKTASRP